MEFVDLKRQYKYLKNEILIELESVLENASYINGPVIKEVEEKLAEYIGVKHAICCSSGTDALMLSMIALNVHPGDEVIVPDFSFFATAETVAFLGAVPVFVDIRPDTFNIDSSAISDVITDKTVGIIPVSLYGQVADIDEINEIAKKKGLWVLEDAAQSYGSKYKDRYSCGLTQIGITSFFPAKPLGCYGDGGAIFTDDDKLAFKLRLLLNHGQQQRYDHVLIGTNARMDSLQAAVLKVKLKYFDEENRKKQEIASFYTEKLKDLVTTPIILDHNDSVWAQYTIRLTNREALQTVLKQRAIPSAVHYPKPLHQQTAFDEHFQRLARFPQSEKAAAEVLSLPMHPYLENDEIDAVCAGIKEAL